MLRRRYWLTLLYIVLLVGALGFTACAHQMDSQAKQAAERRIEDYRMVSASLKKHPKAGLVERDMTRVNSWLRRAEVMLNDEDRDPKVFALLLDTIEGQLIQVRSTLSRLDAEQALEQERLNYERRAIDLNKRRKATQVGDQKEAK